MCKRKPVSEKKQNLGSKVLVVQKKMCRILILTFVDEMLLGVWWMKRYNLYYLENSSQEKVKFQLAVSPLFLKDGKRLLAGKNGIGNGFEIST